MHSLPVFIRLSGRPVILLGDGDAASAKRRLLERAGAMIVGEDAQAALAIVAIEDDAEAEAAIARLKARGVLVNAVAKALRQRLEALMPATLGGLAQALGTARAKLRARWPDGADRRRAIDAALDPGGPLDPFGAGSAEAVATWLQSGQDGATANFHHIKVHSDDPDDLTLAQARILARADLVLHQARVAPHVN
jgi:uroporphyrin-III C-methyltransferase/precorrin-2 dehydrogenase/sirohydrochlorin ferrochelatase